MSTKILKKPRFSGTVSVELMLWTAKFDEDKFVF